MKKILLILFLIIQTTILVAQHTEKSRELNLYTIQEIKNSIVNKIENVENIKKYENLSVINEHDIYIKYVNRTFKPKLYFKNIQDIRSNNDLYAIRLIENSNGIIEFSIMVNINGEYKNYQANFFDNGDMIEDDVQNDKVNYSINALNIFSEINNNYAINDKMLCDNIKTNNQN